MPDPFIGEIRMVAFDYAPVGWVLCQGQLLPVSQYSALFALLGTVYGGDGRSNFGVPDLRGRSPVGMGAGSSFAPVNLGAKGGAETTTLANSQLPPTQLQSQFAGTASAVSGSVAVGTDASAAMVPPASGGTTYLSAASGKVGLNNVVFNGLFSGTAPSGSTAQLGGWQGTVTPSGAVTVAPFGGGQPVPLRNPYLGMNFIMATAGEFPVRP
jgi:microcystin-dependent protein